MKRTGRPRLDRTDDTAGVYVSMPARQLDEIHRRALREDVSVPEIIRRDLDKARQKKSEK